MKPLMNPLRIFGLCALTLCGLSLAWRMWPWPEASTISRSKSTVEVELAPVFKEVTDSAGLTFRHWCGDSGTYFVPESMGSGIALLDYDQDGDLDIYVVQGMPVAAGKVQPPTGSGFSTTSRLFRQTKGRFEDVTESVGLADQLPYGMGVAVGDVNNDGWPDLFITKYGGLQLYVNRQGKFQDITSSAGIANPSSGSSACFIDYDRDGWLDLFVGNYYDYSPHMSNGLEDYPGPLMRTPVPSKLFRNTSGDSGPSKVHFRDRSVETGVNSKAGPALGVLPADFNGDGWIDFYIANDSTANFVWINQGGKTFTEEAVPRGAAFNAAGAPQASMGVTAGDVDGDGKQDLFMTHLEHEYSTLYQQVSLGVFEDRTAAFGLATPTIPYTGFGTALLDLDLDGDLDLVIGNGRVRRRGGESPANDGESFWNPYREPNQLFLNYESVAFTAVSRPEDGFLAQPRVTRGLAVGDIDNDGDADLVTSEVNGPARIFLNIAQRKGNWLLVRAVDPRLGGRDAYGATVTVAAGEERWSRDINPAYSYLSSNDPRAHFGLGNVATIDHITVLWPDGMKELFAGRSVNALHTLRRGEGTPP